MKKVYWRIIIILGLAVFPFLSFPQEIVSDSVLNGNSEIRIINGVAESNEELLFKAAFFTIISASVLVFLFITFFAFLVGLVVLIIVGAMVFSGIISVAFLIGFYKESVDKGIKIFFILAFGVIGSFFCTILFPVLNKIMHWATFEKSLVVAIVLGFISGSAAGLLMYKFIVFAWTRIMTRMKLV